MSIRYRLLTQEWEGGEVPVAPSYMHVVDLHRLIFLRRYGVGWLRVALTTVLIVMHRARVGTTWPIPDRAGPLGALIFVLAIGLFALRHLLGFTINEPDTSTTCSTSERPFHESCMSSA